LRQFEATKEKHRWDIANNFWNFVTADHIYSIGGTGETEMFRPKGQIAKYISEKTAESCATYNMLKLTGMLYQYHGSAEYMHYYENGVTNHILSSGDTSGPTGLTTYFMPSCPCGHKEFDKEENSCCHGTGYENHFKYGEYIYAKDNDSLIVNLFISNRLDNGEDIVEIAAKAGINSFDVTVKAEKLCRKVLKIRKPLWAVSAEITVDKQTVTPKEENGYYVFEMEKGVVTICAAGSGNPFFTTDTAASLRAAELNCDVILKATKTDGVYNADPFTTPDAQRYTNISFQDVISKKLKVMDTAAVALAEESNIPIVVFSIYERGNLGKILYGEGCFSTIS
jgi:hypothetical protein